MKMKYDPEVDAAYISFKKGNSMVTTIRINEDVAIDLGENEEIVGIEILDASEYFEFTKRKPKVELENFVVA